MEKIRIGIIGAGGIAGQMALTLKGMTGVEAYAIASRSLQSARDFADRWGFTRAYGSYEEMLDDEQVQLVYIATPHSHHLEHARMCLLKGKPVLCEKAFTANARQAEELLNLAKEKKVFITEAIWTRYMPLSQTINKLIADGVIGRPMTLSANLGYSISDRERLIQPALAGGALLDLGVYTLNFASMVFGTGVERIASTCVKTDTGVDAQNSITLVFDDGKMAVLHSTMLSVTDRQGIISGDKGHLIVENINNPQRVTVVTEDYKTIAVYNCPPQITGYEYQVYASIEALRNGWLESPYMPHAETLRIMRIMDGLRREWGVHYPFED
ncbi:Gfo/Idh/MocA family oxidoreductase [Bacteroides sp. GD17]|uniref:Gfo/Idh/MocA family protein n=1 Tax=Bacteroides sp. GD17 TaxID=3139826 RepID=UPI0025EC5824|nr:Gfo/Idh/MocA family oxidoreductase [uncultured Bacteroides sp.]